MKKIKDNKLLIIFLILLIVVISLSIKIFYLEKTRKNNKKELVDMVVPITNKNSNYSFKLELNELKKDKKIIYIFKVTNYRNKDINKTNINYNLKIESDENIDISLQQDNKNVSNNIENIKLNKNKKSVKLYKIIIVPKENIKSGRIAVNINS